MSNTLQAIYRAAQNGNQKLVDVYKAMNRANAMGDALEEYVKDIYSGVSSDDKAEAIAKHSKTFSFVGTQNHPPDLMLRKSDAIEVKKVGGFANVIQLNSSYPKSKLHHDDTRITKVCRECEDWKIRDIVYIVGCVNNNELKMLWFVYGDCYAASREMYESVRKTVRKSLADGNFAIKSTNELAQVPGVDPLGITALRVRGLWTIKNPARVFDYLYKFDKSKSFQGACVMKKEKYLSFPLNDRKLLESSKLISVVDAKAQSPDNPADLLDVKLISFSK